MFNEPSHEQSKPVDPLTPKAADPAATLASSQLPASDSSTFSHLSTMPDQFYAAPKKKLRWGVIIITITIVTLLIAGMMLFNQFVNKSPDQSAFNFFRKKIAPSGTQDTNQPAAANPSDVTAPTPPASDSSNALPPSSNTQAPISSLSTPTNTNPSSTTTPGQEGFTPPTTLGNNSPALGTVQSSSDQDNDGLTDEEEKIYGSDPNVADTDHDGYQDGAEVVGGYSPIDSGGKTLLDTKKASLYTNQTYRYSFWFPTGWLAQPTDSSGQEILVTSPTGEFASVQVQPNTNNETASAWYARLNPLAKPADIGSFKTPKGLEGITSADGLNHYVRSPDGKWIIVIAYNIGLRDKANFLSTILMLRNALSINP